MFDLPQVKLVFSRDAERFNIHHMTSLKPKDGSNLRKPLIIFVKGFILDISQDSENLSVTPLILLILF